MPHLPTLGFFFGFAHLEKQEYQYSALGIRTGKVEWGNPNRLALEELLAGKALPDVEEGYDEADWVKTSYIQDITQGYGEVVQEIRESAKGTVRTSYTYGLERISALETAAGWSLKTEYVYDVRGSVIQKLAGNTVESVSYTPFGEQLGGKTSGYGYNGEDYDAAVGSIHLRVRQYEPAMNRFSQKDILRGGAYAPRTQNRYAFVLNDPVNLVDPSGLSAESYTVARRVPSEDADEYYEWKRTLLSATPRPAATPAPTPKATSRPTPAPTARATPKPVATVKPAVTAKPAAAATPKPSSSTSSASSWAASTLNDIRNVMLDGTVGATIKAAGSGVVNAVKTVAAGVVAGSSMGTTAASQSTSSARVLPLETLLRT